VRVAILASVALAASVIGGVATGTIHQVPNPKGCESKACEKRVHKKRMRHKKLRTIKPYRRSFLGPTGACESGTTMNLHHGLRAVDPSGTYRGRYQFNMSGWRGAGGRGDPIDANWLEQAYRAVRWLHINGRQSWPNC
jgi:hypothetical protein